MLKAHFRDERAAFAEGLHIGSFGHQQNPVTGESGNGPDLVEELLDLGKILDTRDHELELAGSRLKPLPDDFGLKAGGFMAFTPRACGLGIGGGVGQLGAQRGKVTGYPHSVDMERDRRRGLDGDVHPGRTERRGEFADAGGHHRLAAGQHGVTAVVTTDALHDGIDPHLLPLGVPGGVGCVAPAAAEIAARCADEDRGDAEQQPLPLDRVKDLGNPHLVTGFGGRGAVTA